MDRKYILSLLIITCLQQGNVSTLDYRSTSEEAIQYIRHVFKSLKDARYEMIHQIPEVIHGLKYKIKEIIDSNDIDEIVNYIREGIKDQFDIILSSADFDPEAVRDCIDTEKHAVDQLVENVIQGFKTCALDAEYEIKLLSKKMKELNYQSNLLIKNTADKAALCYHDHGLHIVQGVMCLTGCLIQIEEDPVRRQIFKTIEVANEKLIHVPIELTKCYSKYNVVGRQQIIDEFKNCVDNYKTAAPVLEITRPVQTTTSKPEVATQKPGTIPNPEL